VSFKGDKPEHTCIIRLIEENTDHNYPLAQGPKGRRDRTPQ